MPNDSSPVQIRASLAPKADRAPNRNILLLGATFAWTPFAPWAPSADMCPPRTLASLSSGVGGLLVRRVHAHAHPGGLASPWSNARPERNDSDPPPLDGCRYKDIVRLRACIRDGGRALDRWTSCAHTCTCSCCNGWPRHGRRRRHGTMREARQGLFSRRLCPPSSMFHDHCLDPVSPCVLMPSTCATTSSNAAL